MSRSASIVVLFFISLSMTCTRHTPPSADAVLANYFQPTTLSDTTHLELPDENLTPIAGDTIPTTLFFRTLGPLMQQVDYIVDSTSSVVVALQRFPLNERYDGCLVHLTQNWFKHQSVLLFDKQTQRFTERFTVGEWYGGEGGQILIGSWLFDYNGDGNNDLVCRTIEHSTTLSTNDEVEEKWAESAELLLWQKSTWKKNTVDSATLVKNYPIRSVW
ncbi:hypothetical protein [Haliscomenobacter sp.]|uniref:hypothetical protein n=1 Tax=Haliscomenobacter sp. TaxID=2717303 RepID=UPI00359463C8